VARWVWAPCPLGNMFRNISEEEAVETDPRASKEGGEGSTRVDNRLSVGRMTISARMPARVPTRLCAGGRRVRTIGPAVNRFPPAASHVNFRIRRASRLGKNPGFPPTQRKAGDETCTRAFTIVVKDGMGRPTGGAVSLATVILELASRRCRGRLWRASASQVFLTCFYGALFV